MEGTEMWYAVQVQSGREERIRELCQKLISPAVLLECFIPHYQRKRKYRGEWHTEERPLFPGYIFIVSDNADELFFSLKKIPYLTKLLGDKEHAIALYEEEVAFLTTKTGKERCIHMSYGYIVGDQVIITEGAMMNFHGKIKHINRHKREAVIEAEFFGGQLTEIKVGLEIVRKYDKDEDVQL